MGQAGSQRDFMLIVSRTGGGDFHPRIRDAVRMAAVQGVRAELAPLKHQW